MPTVFLAHRCLIEIRGTDARSFLQNLITTDLNAIQPGQAWPGALLTPQGKILFDFLIWHENESFYLETDDSQRDALVKRLTLYRLRAAVEFAVQPISGISVSWGPEHDKAGIQDMRFTKAGLSLFRQPDTQGSDDISLYDRLRIENGIAISGADFALQDAFPHDVLMDLNGGLSFRKGCYVGQEVVSRMQHRSTARKRVVVVSSQNGEPLPASGTSLLVNNKSIGVLGTVVDRQALALARIDRLGEALFLGEPILAGDVSISVSLPSWSGLDFPAKADEAIP